MLDALIGTSIGAFVTFMMTGAYRHPGFYRYFMLLAGGMAGYLIATEKDPKKRNDMFETYCNSFKTKERKPRNFTKVEFNRMYTEHRYPMLHEK